MEARVLEEAIERDPDDLGARLVHADWLQHRGDLRGELAIVQHALMTATGAQRDELAARELRDQEPAFRHLARLGLDSSYLSDDGVAAVNGICREVSARNQREDDADGDRYVGVSE